jgi:hypothetical protein
MLFMLCVCVSRSTYFLLSSLTSFRTVVTVLEIDRTVHNRGNSGNKDKQKQTSEVLNESRETLYGTDRPNDPLSNSMFFQLMTRLDDRLKTTLFPLFPLLCGIFKAPRIGPQ